VSVIELGDYAAGQREPAPAETRRLFDRHLRRQIALVLVGVLCLALVQASAVPQRTGLGAGWDVAFDGSDSFLFSRGALVVLRNDRQQTLAAYDLAGGKPRWSRKLPYEATDLYPTAVDGVALMPIGQVSRTSQTAAGQTLWNYYSTETVAVDTATGRELWREPGDVAEIAGHTAVLVTHSGDGPSVDQVRLVRVGDGGTVWSAPSDAYDWALVGPDHLVTVSLTGDLRSYRLADGTLLARRTIPWSSGSLTDRTSAHLQGANGLLYELTGSLEGAGAAAYDPATLQERWRVSSNGASGPAPCGAVVCLPESGGFAGYDSRTGAVRWRVAGHAYAEPMIGDLLLTDGGRTAGHVVLDDRTGAQVADLGAGGAVWDTATGVVVGLAPTQSPAGRTSVTRIDPRTAQTYLLGSIDRIVDPRICKIFGNWLACANVEGRMAVTEVP
jgi:outer membrane protein assembly factor BamB